MKMDRHTENFLKQSTELIQAHKFIQAEDFIEMEITLNPKFIPAHCEFIRLALLTGNIDLALKRINHATRLAPENPYIMAYQGYWYISNAEYGKALDTLEYVKSLVPDESDVWANLAVSYRFLGNLEKAESYAKKAESLDSKRPFIYLELARISLRQGKTQASMDYLEEAIKHDPKFTQAYISLARMLVGKNDLARAANLLKLGLKYQPDDIPLLENIAEIAERKGDPDTVIFYREKLTRLRKTSSDYNKLGIFYSLNKNFKKAKNAFETLAQLTGNSWSSLNNLAQMYMEAKDYENAEVYYAKAIKENPDALLLQYNLAFMYLSKKDYERGIQWAQKALNNVVSDFWADKVNDLISQFPDQYKSLADSAKKA